MTEARASKRYLDRIRKDNPGAFVWKIREQVLGGIPDAMVVVNGITEWFEFKVGDPSFVDKLVRPLQKLMIKRLQQAGADVWVVVFDKAGAHHFKLSDSGNFVEMFLDRSPF